MGILDQFRGEKIRAAFDKDTQPGYYVRGQILDVSVSNRTDYKTGDVLYFKDGKPKQQVVITIQTDIRDGADDDGRRRVYVKMDYKSDREGLVRAVEAAGDDDVRVGGELAAQFLGQLKDEHGVEQAWNTTKYEYRKPNNLAAANGGIPHHDAVPSGPGIAGHTAAAQPVPSAPAQDPAAIAAAVLAQRQAAQAPPAAPVADAATSEAVRSLIAAGLDDATIAGAFPAVKRELIVALRNAAALT